MVTPEMQKEGQGLINTLVQKAWESSDFKQELVRNPISAMESVKGKKIQSDIKFIVEDQTDESIIYLNIPRKVDTGSLELTDEQLEMVAGGEGPILVACAVLTLIGGSFYAGYSMGKDRAATLNPPAK